MLKPIWDAFSRENMLKSIFPKESPQIRVRKWLQMKTTIVPLRPTTPKRASANERAIKRGAGASPPRLFASGLSLEKAWIPPGTGRETYGAGSNLRHPLPLPGNAWKIVFVKSFEIHCVFLAIFDKKCYPKSEERETSPEGHRNHRRPPGKEGTG